ncbi:MAG TPA: von Willebrand factor type A domain-containing protein, partial [Verrucomicrobiae bacterium]|nr:von Willebrand factor type A domain-containing protein [Verrucomicrobiae bacterium]
MNPEFPQNERAQLEAKLTALLLGELHADEVAALRNAMEQDAELAALYERLKATVELVREGAAQPKVEQASLKLSAEKREKLLASFKTAAPKEFAKPRRVMDWLVPLAACVAIVGVLAVMLLPSLAGTKRRARVGRPQTDQLASMDYTKAPSAPNTLTITRGRQGEYENLSDGLRGERQLREGVRTPSPANETVASTPGFQFGLVPTEVAPASVKRAPIVLPPGQEGDVGKVPGQTMADSLDQNKMPIHYAFSSDIGGALKQLGSQQTNELALNRSQVWQAGAPKNADDQMLLFGDENINRGAAVSQGSTVTNGVAPGAMAFNADADRDQTSYRMLSRLGTEADQGKLNLHYTNGDKAPVLGDLPSVGRLFKGDSTVAQNEDFKTALTRDDVSGLQYLATNAAVASRSLSWGPIEGATNAAAVAADTEAFQRLNGADSLGKDAVVNSGALTLGGTVTGSSKVAVRRAYIVPPSSSDGLLTSGLRTPNHASEIVQAENRKSEIVLPAVTDGLGFGGGGNSGPVLMARKQQASSGKQVELAAAANAPKQRAAEPSMSVGAKLAEVDSDDNRAPGYDWYLGNKLMTNGSVVASGGTVPAEEARLSEQKRATMPSTQEIERVKAIHEENIQTSQMLQDGKLLFQLGKTDEAESKLNEALARDPANQGALYYLSLIKQQRVRQVVDARNVTSMTRMAQVETAWRDNGARQQLSAPSMPRTNSISSSNWRNGTATAKGIYDDGANSANSNVSSTALLETRTFKVDPNSFYGKLQNSSLKQPLSESDRALISTNQPRRFRYVTGLEPTTELNLAFVGFLRDAGVKLDASKGENVFFDDREGTLRIEGTAGDVDKVKLLIETINRNTPPEAETNQTQKIDAALPKPPIPPPTPQPEILTRENAVSTFSLNVSDVSFKLAAASLEKGQMPEPASIRSEEFINAFDYRDPEAAPGVPIAFAAERARYPFAHNRELLRFSLKTAAAGRQAGRPLNIVLLLDNSGSMERADRVSIIREALRVLAKQLQASDTFSIVTFARTAQLRVDGIPGSQAAAAEEIAKLTPEGGTNLGEALDLAYETALHHYLANGDNRVVLLTDGAANLGDVNPEVLKQKVEAQRQQGVALDCFGIGWEGYNDDLLEVLTRNGDGRYGFINTPEAADTDFVAQIAGALHVAAADVKVQVEFNTNRVTSYRQIGYAKHQLT